MLLAAGCRHCCTPVRRAVQWKCSTSSDQRKVSAGHSLATCACSGFVACGHRSRSQVKAWDAGCWVQAAVIIFVARAAASAQYQLLYPMPVRGVRIRPPREISRCACSVCFEKTRPKKHKIKRESWIFLHTSTLIPGEGSAGIHEQATRTYHCRLSRSVVEVTVGSRGVFSRSPARKAQHCPLPACLFLHNVHLYQDQTTPNVCVKLRNVKYGILLRFAGSSAVICGGDDWCCVLLVLYCFATWLHPHRGHFTTFAFSPTLHISLRWAWDGRHSIDRVVSVSFSSAPTLL